MYTCTYNNNDNNNNEYVYIYIYIYMYTGAASGWAAAPLAATRFAGLQRRSFAELKDVKAPTYTI